MDRSARVVVLARRLPALALALALFWAVSPATARTVTDMGGQTSQVPDAPRRVYALSPPDTLLVFAVAPCLLAGWNYPQYPATLAWMPECVRHLPVLGGFFGKDAMPDTAALSRQLPDLVISGTMSSSDRDFDPFFTRLGIPVVHIESGDPAAYPEAMRLLGRLFGCEGRAETLARYAEDTLAEIRRGVASIPPEKRVRVYYAEGGDGLFTDGRDSFHTQVLRMAGGINVHGASQQRRMGMDRVTLRQVIDDAPDVILAQDAACRTMILSSPEWKAVPAVRNNRVLLLPDQPLGWFDRPPSFMRYLGLKWLAHALYPETFPYDMVRETQQFMKLFYARDITPAEADALLHP